MKPLSWFITWVIVTGGMVLAGALGLPWDWKIATVVGTVACATEGACLFANGWFKNPTPSTWI